MVGQGKKSRKIWNLLEVKPTVIGKLLDEKKKGEEGVLV